MPCRAVLTLRPYPVRGPAAPHRAAPASPPAAWLPAALLSARRALARHAAPRSELHARSAAWQAHGQPAQGQGRAEGLLSAQEHTCAGQSRLSAAEDLTATTAPLVNDPWSLCVPVHAALVQGGCSKSHIYICMCPQAGRWSHVLGRAQRAVQRGVQLLAGGRRARVRRLHPRQRRLQLSARCLHAEEAGGARPGQAGVRMRTASTGRIGRGAHLSI